MQNSKSYEDLKAELGNSGDWGQITAVSMGQVEGAPTVSTDSGQTHESSESSREGARVFCFLSIIFSFFWMFFLLFNFKSCADLSPPFPSEMAPKFYHV